MAIASIAVYDWPENWPDLLPFLLKLINDRTNVSGGKSLGWLCEVFLICDYHTHSKQTFMKKKNPEALLFKLNPDFEDLNK